MTRIFLVIARSKLIRRSRRRRKKAGQGYTFLRQKVLVMFGNTFSNLVAFSSTSLRPYYSTTFKEMTHFQTIPARRGVARHIKKGQTIQVINTHGTQVVDTWAFSEDIDSSTMTPPAMQYMSMQHTRCSISKLVPEINDSLRSNERKLMLTVLEDTTTGAHDTLISACDRWRYQELGVVGPDEYHDNCADNMVQALKDLGLTPPTFIPSPLNLFMNVPVHSDRRSISYEKPTSQPGQYVTFRAEMDLVIVFSACPNDAVQTNSWKTLDAHYRIS